MPRRSGKQGRPRSFLEMFDGLFNSAEDAALRAVDGAAQRLEAELEKGASQLVRRIAESSPKSAPSDRSEVCQCEGNVYYGPDGLCQECGLPAGGDD